LSNPYDLIPTEEGFDFQTPDYHYITYFTDSETALFKNVQLDSLIVIFGFDTRPEVKSMSKINGHVSRKFFDERIQATILLIIQKFFDANPHSILAIVCSTKDDRQRQRKIVFSKWYKSIKMDTIVKTDLNYENVHLSYLYRKGHPFESMLKEEIDILTFGKD